MKNALIIPLRHNPFPASAGRKAVNLRRLSAKGFRIPVTFALGCEAYLAYRSGDPELPSRLRLEIDNLLRSELAYAVRSSANLEDRLEHTFAGQFKSVLDVRGSENILVAIQEVWEAACSPGVMAYLEKMGAGSEICMGIVIQEMVTPVLSGVAFSRNPITGFDEVVVEAVEGSGELLVQEGVTPQRWVNKWGRWLEQPHGKEEQVSLFEEIARQTLRVRKAMGHDVDLEWVFDGRLLYWVQQRQIAPVQAKIYSNKLAREMLPGLIKPLVWSVNTPIVNGAWVDLLAELIGKNNIEPASLSRLFHYRAYFDMTAFGHIFERLGLPAESLEMMMGVHPGGQKMPMYHLSPRTLALLPRLLPVMIDKFLFSRRVERDLPWIEAEYRALAKRQLVVGDEAGLVALLEALKQLTRQAAYLNIVGQLLMSLYNGMLRWELQRLGLDYESFDLMAGFEEAQKAQPGYHLQRLHEQFSRLSPPLQAQMMHSNYAQFLALTDAAEFQSQVVSFIENFGHLSDNGNDLSCVPWREDPDLILRMITFYHLPERASDRGLDLEQAPVRGLRRWVLTSLCRRARRFRLYREQISSTYTYGYGLFRLVYLALGERLVQRGELVDRQDIFYLYDSEVRAAVERAPGRPDFANLAMQRKHEMAQAEQAVLPEIIYGEQPPPLLAPSGRSLRGTPTSRGCYTGPVRNVRGLFDFNKVEAGDVLVAPFADVGWTPLFARAGAVIAEAGGMLSHSSIIAREYQIPAVVSVAGALLLTDGTQVTVNGYTGEIMIHT